MPNFQKVIDILSEAFTVFDFSHIISGSCSFLIIIYDLYCHDIFFFVDNIGLTIVCGVFLSYVCGLLSWIIGKRIRYGVQDVDQSFETVYNEVMMFVEKYQLQGDLPLLDVQDRESAHSYMWTGLEKTDKAKEKICFIRKFWVMRAVFEGLITSCLLGILVLIDLVISEKIEIWPTALVLAILLFGCACLSAKEARIYAENQIREVILSYYVYVSK